MKLWKFIPGEKPSFSLGKIKTAYLIIRVMLVCLLFILILISCSSDYEKLNNKIKKEAINVFNNDILYKKGENENYFQSMIDAITEGKNYFIHSDIPSYIETGHFNFPLIANQETVFVNRKDKSNTVVIEKLYIYEFGRNAWIPISERKLFIKKDKLTSSKETDLWDKSNDWAETFRKK